MNANGQQKLRVGMKVRYRTCFGGGPSKVATVESIELCKGAHQKEGIETDEVWVKDVYRCVLGLSDEHWAYGEQVDAILP
jgi:hypothetical protein